MARKNTMPEPQPRESVRCALCGRELGGKTSMHHLIPKSKGGKYTDTIELHQICHSKIHDVFTETQLLRNYNTIAKLLAHEEMAKFVEWLQGKPPDFYTRGKKKKR